MESDPLFGAAFVIAFYAVAHIIVRAISAQSKKEVSDE